MTQPILSIANHHFAAPPDFQIGERDYVGYFENEHGEQLVFVYRSDDGTGWLWGGDPSASSGQAVGWDNKKEVTGGLPPWIMGAAETSWLTACWCAATTGVSV